MSKKKPKKKRSKHYESKILIPLPFKEIIKLVGEHANETVKKRLK
jgi:hypothetical protein